MRSCGPWATPPPRPPSWSGTWPGAPGTSTGCRSPWRTPAYGAALARARARRADRGAAARGLGRPGRCGAPPGGGRRDRAGHAGPARPRSPRPPPGGAVLHLVTNALPETVAGYTVRTQGIARAQRARGLDVHVATRIGFPVTKGHLGAAARVTVRRGRAPPGAARPAAAASRRRPGPGRRAHRPAGQPRCGPPCCTRTATT